MIYSVTVVNNMGDELTIELRHPEKSGLIVRSISGLGPVKALVNTTNITTGDGSIFNSARLDQRNIVFSFSPIDGIIDGETEYSSVEDNRLKLMRYFPLKKKVGLYFQTENRFAYTEGYVETNDPDIFSQEVTQSVSIICPYPYFYDMSEEGSSTIHFSTNEAWFEFPDDPIQDDRDHNDMSDDSVEFGIITLKHRTNIFYSGDADTGMIIRLHAVGSVENISIFNTNTLEQMRIDTDKLAAITGSVMIDSDDIIINTNPGEKSILLYRAGSYYNILNCVNRDANWFILSKGDNPFVFTAESGEQNLQFEISIQNLFEGI